MVLVARRPQETRSETHPRAQIRRSLHLGPPPRTGDGTRMAITPSAFQWMGHHTHPPTQKKTAKPGIQPEQVAGQRMVSGAPDETGRCPHSTDIRALPHPIWTQSAVSANAPTVHPKSITLPRLVQKHNGLLANRRCGHNRRHIGRGQKCASTNLGGADWLCHLFGCRTLTQMRPNRENGTQESS